MGRDVFTIPFSSWSAEKISDVSGHVMLTFHVALMAGVVGSSARGHLHWLQVSVKLMVFHLIGSKRQGFLLVQNVS